MDCTKRSFFCSWSGGKDSCLAFYHALQAGGEPRCLFTMLSEAGERSRAHALPLRILEQQAESLGIPLVSGVASWEGYEKVFIDQLRRFKKEGIEFGVFGDIDLEEHRQWQEKVCSVVGMGAYLPLWGRPRREIVAELVDSGFQAMIVTVDEQKMERKYLGRVIDRPLMDELEKRGIDIAGENGEYHTLITDGPLFKKPLSIEVKGIESHEKHCFLKVDAHEAAPSPSDG